MKKTGIFAAVIIVVCTAVYVVSNILVNNKEAESQKDIQSADDKSVVYASLDEIRSQAADELDDIKNGKYPNMKCGDIHLDITDLVSTYVEPKYIIHFQQDLDNLQQAFNEMQKDLEVLKEYE